MRIMAEQSATTTPGTGSEALSWWTIGLYGFPTIAVHFLYMLILVMYMNFATDVLLMAPATIGAIFFLSKLWDAVSDPVVGFLSDRTRSRLGRRRSWMLGSALPVAGFGLMLWSPPQSLSPSELALWVGVAIFGFYTAYTTFYVPQLALGAELSFEGRERTRVFGARQVGSAIGLLLAFSLGAPLLENHETARTTAADLAWIGGIACVLSILIATPLLPREPVSSEGRGGRNLLVALRDVWRNPHARLLLFVYFIEVFGIGGTSAMTAYILKYVTKAEKLIGFIFLAYTITSVLSIPLWIWLGSRFERHRIWLFAMGLGAIGYGLILFQGEGRVALMVASSLINGLAASCGATLGQAIKADVVDYDEYLTGERKEGAYFATWNFAGKLGTGLMMALAGFALQAAGFEPNVEQSATTRWTILFIAGGAPFLCMGIGIAAFTRFRLDSRLHAEVRAEIDRRTASPR
jgi:GPH family glycoside/pentoside/hexuronide:cation symporter